ncbi:sulfur carrier protein ThiS [Bacillus sp. ISL-51]|uniref:sulfur carrier protein ThiS n=1 Tax=unclassified Bacillus (in: firmicutes) TaxID=185979 RepID=UPI001BE8DCFE|nr:MULTISPECIES: sulfur carrier protein ThiS [unclassified Bacillus (in: firmicutes)]MBT2573797.1 sulfur carrier protein ThiS [Bacillus sp. ISL-51]MBT2634871.1 sulfur carrier protein ThiS [Bacillus sp. ISL-26]MBY8912466.1 sulfur carrier protein ThiS [Bacillus sp. YC2]
MLQLNGKQIEWDKEKGTIQDLLESYQLDQKIVVVERNKEIIEKKNYRNVGLCDRDVIEIVHFVGGG